MYYPFLGYETGDAFMHHFYQAADGHIDPFCPVIEGSIPNEAVKDEGYWANLRSALDRAACGTFSAAFPLMHISILPLYYYTYVHYTHEYQVV
jgi:hypothetical protein